MPAVSLRAMFSRSRSPSPPPHRPSLTGFLSRYRSRSFNLKTAFHAFELHTGQSSIGAHIPFLPFSFRLSHRPISSLRVHSPPPPFASSLSFRYIFARFLHLSSFEPSEKGFVREPFIFSRVSRPDAFGPMSRR